MCDAHMRLAQLEVSVEVREGLVSKGLTNNQHISIITRIVIYSNTIQSMGSSLYEVRTK